MPFPKKKNPKLQEASKKGHLARWGGKRIKVEAEAKLPLPLLELPEELRALIFEAVGCRGVGAVAQVCRLLAAEGPPIARAIAAAEDAAAAAVAAAAAKAAAERKAARQRRIAPRIAAEARRERLVGARLRVLLDAGNALERWAAGAIVDYTMDGEPTVAGGGSYYTFYMEENGGYIDERWAADAEFAKWCCMCEVSAGNECEVCAQGRTRSYIVTELPEEG